MPENPEKIVVTANERDKVTALLYTASKKNRAGTTLILGHGAGSNQTSPFMRLFAGGIAERGLDVMTFNFIYMEQGRSVPDPKAKLEACFRTVIDTAFAHKKLKGNRIVAGGKSMGGRIASQVAAEEDNPSVPLAGLVFLGYPLHPPGRPEKMRDAHLKLIRAPMLFIQGTRDAFGTPEELRSVIKRDGLPATLQVVEGGDHSFKVPKTAALSQEQVYDMAMDLVASWSSLNTR